MKTLRLPPRFIEDCLDCDCDVGTYANGKLTASVEQLNELQNRAEFYADAAGPDLAPRGLKTAAKALLKALHHGEASHQRRQLCS